MSLEALQMKRVALAGFDAATASDLASKLDSAMAFCRSIAEEDAGPGSALLGNFDLLLLAASAAKPWYAVPGRDSDVPLLVVGAFEELLPDLPGLSRRGRSFILPKPSREELLLRAAALLTAPRARPREDSKRAPTVVAADDDLSVSALVKALLTSDGVTCETAKDGGVALELARSLKPDVLLLDVNMPRMGGFEVLSAIKLDPATAFMRVILLTGAEQESDIMRGFSLGAADYIVKPFNPMELLVRIRRFLRN
jgi:CheY-like chemotaxis protein